MSESSASEVFGQIYHMGKGDVFIPITFPRYSRRSLKATEFAKYTGAHVIGIKRCIRDR